MNGAWLEIDADGVVVNMVRWDGVTEYSPAGMTLLPCADNPGVSYGWRLVDGVWLEPESSVG